MRPFAPVARSIMDARTRQSRWSRGSLIESMNDETLCAVFFVLSSAFMPRDYSGTPARRTLRRIPGAWAVARLDPHQAVPDWATPNPAPNASAFLSITRSDEELSIIAPEAIVPSEVRAERGFALLRVDGPIPFDAVGVLRAILSPLEDAGVAVVAISTFDTDHLLIPAARETAALAALRGAGFRVE